jgi:hypothetical protein
MFAARYPTAYKALRWLPRTPATPDPEDAMLDRIIATLEKHKAKRLAQEGQPGRPPATRVI